MKWLIRRLKLNSCVGLDSIIRSVDANTAFFSLISFPFVSRIFLVEISKSTRAPVALWLHCLYVYWMAVEYLGADLGRGIYRVICTGFAGSDLYVLARWDSICLNDLVLMIHLSVMYTNLLWVVQKCLVFFVFIKSFVSVLWLFVNNS